MRQLKYTDLVPEMQRLRELGWSYPKIGKELELSYKTIMRYLNPEERAKHVERNQSFYRSHPGYKSASMWKFRAELRPRLLALYGDKCAKCGESNLKVLQLNHIHGGGKKDRRKSGGKYYLYGAILSGNRNKEDYNLLCANCNILYEYERGRISKPASLHLDALLRIGDRCAECGVTDVRVLQINHLISGGWKKEAGYNHNMNFYRAILNGTRSTDDLNVLCANHNALFKPLTSWRTESEAEVTWVTEEREEEPESIADKFAGLKSQLAGRS